jgi:hypothetical protein
MPEITMVVTTMRLTLTPLAIAAVSDAPAARRSNPNRVLLSSTQYTRPTTADSRMRV